ncbi:MAG: minichromosome maintenance protein MCM [Nanoarchaeota archaeon]|nr:minichromosome maintenance protein MCM [Nanoarchaeota archaeon]
MDASDQIKSFGEFFERHHAAELFEAIRTGQKFFIIDFLELSKFNPELADDLLENPEDVIRASEIAVEQLDAEGDVKGFKIRFKHLPLNQNIMIKDIRAEHIGKFLAIIGLVRQKSDVRPKVTIAKFECPSCGNIISVLQLDSTFKEPYKCGCGRKGKFRLLSKDLVDAQGIVLEESPEDLEGGEQPKRINILLERDLVSPISEKRTNPGSKILVNGILKESPIILRTGMRSTKFDLFVESNYVEAKEETYGDIQITPEEEAKIKELSEDKDLNKKLISSIAPSIYGHDKIKEALIMQLVGGVRKKRKDGAVNRGDIHILLIGDPGSGKSQLLKRITNVAPKARYVSGKGASAAGLTASVVKDEFLKGWSLEAGALPLTNRGICMIDELDKMTKEDRSAMHEALEQQTISIAKANIQATLRCETTVLAAANPKFGRFDPYDTIARQIDLPPALINRFDLIFPIKDLPSPEKDEKMAKFILSLHKDKTLNADIETDMLKKYIAYAKQKFEPVLTESAFEELKDYYLQMRASGSVEGTTTTIPISARQLEALVRLSEAAAKLRLSDKVQKRDAKKAIDLLHSCLMEVGYDKETGKIDIDRITSGISASQRSKIGIIKEIISELENKVGKTIDIADIMREASSRNVEEDEVEEVIEKLKRSGDIFEPKRGFVQRIN